MSKGRLIIVSGPSGAGKTSVVKQLVDRCPLPLVLSVSVTTRPARPGEVDGVDYQFLSDDEFKRRHDAGDFLECFEVFGRGYWYGTLKVDVEENLSRGNWVLLEIDVNGMQQVVAQFPQAITLFVRTSSLEELERRLRNRKTETEESIQRRLEVAEHEWQFKDLYKHDIINMDLDQTVQRVLEILQTTSLTPVAD